MTKSDVQGLKDLAAGLRDAKEPGDVHFTAALVQTTAMIMLIERLDRLIELIEAKR